jgi:amino acid adenylation domain-containing protein
VLTPAATAPRAGALASVHPETLAYALHTSGTTGDPKLIGVPHRAVVNYLRWCVDTYQPAAGSHTPVHSPLGFDLTVTALFAPLVSGGTIDLLPADAGLEALGEALAAGADGLLKITPAHLDAVGQQLRLCGVRPGVGSVVVGGEQLRRRHLEPWRGLAPDGPVFNEYGPTETTVGCCVFRTGADAEDPVPIGRPIHGTSAYVLDDGCPVAAGVPAELHVGGDGLARGYLGQPGLTAERFMPDPFGAGTRLYRTGDLARLGGDGMLRFVGRRDRQVKVRGYRVEPAEIEQVLCRHPGVRQAAVVPEAGSGGRHRLVTYWVAVPEDDPPADDRGLAAWLAARLPAYLVPDAFVRLPTLPLTARGKVDYAALPALATARRDALLALAEGLTDAAAREMLAMAKTGGGAQ